MSNFYPKVSTLLSFWRAFQNYPLIMSSCTLYVSSVWFICHGVNHLHFAVVKVVQNLVFLCCGDYPYRSEVAGVDGTYPVWKCVFSLSSKGKYISISGWSVVIFFSVRHYAAWMVHLLFQLISRSKMKWFILLVRMVHLSILLKYIYTSFICSLFSPAAIEPWFCPWLLLLDDFIVCEMWQDMLLEHINITIRTNEVVALVRNLYA